MKLRIFLRVCIGLVVAAAAQAAEPDLQALFDRANEHFNEGRYDRAIEDYSVVIAKMPDLIEAYNNRGIAYYRKGDMTKR